MAEQGLTEQQRNWLASVRASLERTTGKTLDEWKQLMRDNPESTPRARQRWAKETHGLGQNYYMLVMREMESDAGEDSRDAETLGSALWKDPAPAEIFRAVEAAIAELPDVVLGQRKGYSTFSRRHAFAAARPAKSLVRLGLAVEPAADPRVVAAQREGWSERLTATLVLSSRGEVDDAVAHLLRQAWERS